MYFIPHSKDPTPNAFPSSTLSCVALSQALSLSVPDEDNVGGSDELWNTEIFEGMLMGGEVLERIRAGDGEMWWLASLNGWACGPYTGRL